MWRYYLAEMTAEEQDQEIGIVISIDALPSTLDLLEDLLKRARAGEINLIAVVTQDDNGFLVSEWCEDVDTKSLSLMSDHLKLESLRSMFEEQTAGEGEF
jgi:hypothetical protein